MGLSRIRSFFTNLSLGTKGGLAIAIPVFALLTAMSVFLEFEKQTRHADEWVEHTMEVRGEIRQVVTLLGDAETGTRGYLLTGRADFLTPYLNARKSMAERLASLHRLLRDSPAQLQRLAVVESLAASSLADMEKVRGDADANGTTGSLVLLEAGKATSDRLRQELHAMQEAEEAFQVDRNARAAAAHARLRLAIFAGGLWGFLGGIIAMLIFTEGVSRRVTHLQEVARRVAEGKPIEAPPPAGDEIAQLGLALKDASDLLSEQARNLRAAHAELESRVEQRTAELADANEKQRQAAEELKAVVEASPLAISVLDPEGNVTFWNPGAERIFVWRKDEVIGRSLPIIAADQEEEFRDWLAKFRDGKVLLAVERKHRRKDGALIDAAIWTAPLRDDHGGIRATLLIESDVSQHHALEEQFRQSQKLEAIGRLAGGVAHDFNNLLTVISGYAEMLVAEAHTSPKLVDYANQILQASGRATSLTGQLLTFSRRQRSQPKVVNLNDIVGNCLKLLRRVIGEDVEVITHLEPNLGCVKADPMHLDQVIMNLVVNARDAMSGGGTLTIETANTRLEEEYAGRHVGAPPGRYCLLSITDTGTGMDAETQSRIFEPFFTTKESGKGTGLGLSIVYGVVKQSNGEITVTSEPGKGTSFKIYLPRLEEAPADVAAAECSTEGARGTETVVVCEDEEGIRRLIRTMLTRQGYRVLEYESPQAVIDMFRSSREHVDLLLTDVVMPQMSGIDLTRSVRTLRPNLKVIYMSGYNDNQVKSSSEFDESTAFIEKPFTATLLSQKIREVLSGRTVSS